MQELFDAINDICGRIQHFSDLCWGFPTNLQWYSRIPVLGQLPLAVILLVGAGVYFTIRLKFIQIRGFGRGIRLLVRSRRPDTGISPLGSFFLSTAMRVGPGNILGVTGAIAVGGPGALFWMWVSAFFSMATAYTESTLSQVFKEKRGNDYVGGFAFYGKKLLGNSAFVGVALSLLYIVYAMLCFPAQGFNTVSAVGQIAQSLSGETIPTDSTLYWVTAALLIALMAALSAGGIRKVTRVTNVVVPVMAVIYFITVLLLICLNLDRIPWFFKAVFCGAFRPDAIFGGTMGVALAQGVRRGLMSNEAGQGTLTMPAAASSVEHPDDQGCIQAVGVFLDTMVICTLSAFVVIMGRMWLTDSASAWMEMGKLPQFVSSACALIPDANLSAGPCPDVDSCSPLSMAASGTDLSASSSFSPAGTGTNLRQAVSLVISLCFGLFAFTCLLGFMSFTQICAARISSNKAFLLSVRILSLAVVAFGTLTSIAGLDLGALWNLSDFANLMMVAVNIPLLLLGFKWVRRSTR